MKENEILLVAFDFPPEKTAGTYRTSAITTQLCRRGWTVRVLTIRARPGRSESDAELIPASAHVTRLPSFYLRRLLKRVIYRRHRPDGGVGPPSSVTDDERRGEGEAPGLFRRFARVVNRMITFPDARVGWIIPLTIAAAHKLIRHRCGIVLSSSPPHSSHLAIRLLKFIFPFKWIVDFRDPWTAPPKDLDGKGSVALHRRLERSVLSAADAIIANTPGNEQWLREVFPEATNGKVTVITNGYSDELYASGGEVATDLYRDLSYIGHLYPSMFRKYVRVLQFLRDSGREMPTLHVYGAVPRAVQAGLVESGLSDAVVCRGEVSYRESLEVMQESPALLILLPHGSSYASCVPSKLYSYLRAGRPVVGLVPEGDSADIIRDTGSGVAITSDDPIVMAEELMRFLDEVKAGTVSRRADAAPISAYSWDTLGERLHTLLVGKLNGAAFERTVNGGAAKLQ